MHDPLPAVELRQIRKCFDRRVVLDNVSLSIQPGEFLAILGASGSGKSTLLKMISGIEVPDSGEILLDGADVTASPPYRRPVHTVFQNYALFPHLDVAGNVGFPLRMAGVPRTERDRLVQRALQWVRLEAFAHRSVDLLSGGERQRVALARALVDEPRCVLLDEPLSALDPHLRVQTLELLRDIQARTGATYLYVTHDREEAMRAAHRIGILRLGRLAQVDTPEELYRQPTSAYVAGFIGKISWLPGVLAVSSDGATLRTSAGETVPCRACTLPSNSRMILGVRPEDVNLGPDGFLPARVIDRHFAGAVVVFRLELAGGATIAAETRVEASLPALGETTRVCWDPAATHLFPDDGEGNG